MATKRDNVQEGTSESGLTGMVRSALGVLAPSGGVEDALTLLKRDHREVEGLFAQFEELDEKQDARRRHELVQEVCAVLTVHATLEEELFYPAIRRAGKEAQDLVDEAEVEHGTVKELVARLQAMGPDDAKLRANFTVLREYVRHHVKEEEDEIFDAAKDADIDLDRLGRQLEARKLELMTQVAVERR